MGINKNKSFQLTGRLVSWWAVLFLEQCTALFSKYLEPPLVHKHISSLELPPSVMEHEVDSDMGFLVAESFFQRKYHACIKSGRLFPRPHLSIDVSKRLLEFQGIQRICLNHCSHKRHQMDPSQKRWGYTPLRWTEVTEQRSFIQNISSMRNHKIWSDCRLCGNRWAKDWKSCVAHHWTHLQNAVQYPEKGTIWVSNLSI